MTKIIAVHGATGTQGGSVVRALLKSQWKIRAITRNASGEPAKALIASGVEVVTANYDDPASLEKAYEGVEAIFLVTNYWEHFFTGKSAVGSGEAEAAQALNVVKVADMLPGLKHFIWSTLPGNAEGQPKRTACQHFDFKAKVDLKIKKEYPNLAAKTTFLYIGWYANNLAKFPVGKLFAIPATLGIYIWMSPVSRAAVLPSAGDIRVNVGLFAKAALEQPEKTLGKYVAVVTDTPTHDEVLEYWKAVTGKRAAYLEVNSDDWCSAFGPPGQEKYFSLKAFEENPRWAFDNNPLLAKDLGIENDVVGTRACLESLKDELV
ncbi:NMRAL1 protein [Xylogone sp. PMI_703]|nr:NMRAL1 protein [Xylogone sp. PMI_703]